MNKLTIVNTKYPTKFLTKHIKWNDSNSILFLIILGVAVFLRCLYFVKVPGGVNQDEAMAGVDAWALTNYGTDRFGMRFPVHFTAWKYGQMSVLLSYMMVPFMKVLGFTTLAVRLPMLVLSCLSIILVYFIGKKLFDTKFALIVMALTAINPWHFMQARWSLDCNVFPHIFLLAFYFLIHGLEKTKYLYLSMLFFGLTFYCYGIAIYSVPIFLVVFSVFCFYKKQITIKQLVLCIMIFLIIILPELTVMIINMFQLSTIETPFFTMAYFPESIRSNDILLLNFSWKQFYLNCQSLINVVFLQRAGTLYNSLPRFGTLYRISIPIAIIGLTIYVFKMFRQRNTIIFLRMLALLGFLLTGIWVGVMTFEVNVNRINIIFYPLIFFCAYGIKCIIEKLKYSNWILPLTYTVLAVCFFTTYFTDFAEQIKTYFYADYIETVEHADTLDTYDRLYITNNYGWRNTDVAEILILYSCKIDALYFQETTTITGGRELLPYTQRYHIIERLDTIVEDTNGLYVFHQSDLEEIPFDYQILDSIGNYVIMVVNN